MNGKDQPQSARLKLELAMTAIDSAETPEMIVAQMGIRSGELTQ
jgi:hypothetical protein